MTLEEKMLRRKEQLIRNDIKKIQKMKDKKKAAWLLQSKYGIDCDYIPGYDDGEQPKNTN